MKMRTTRYSRYTPMVGSITMSDHFHWKMIQGAIAKKIRVTITAAEFIEPRATPHAAAVPESALSSTGPTAIAAISEQGGTVVGSETGATSASASRSAAPEALLRSRRCRTIRTAMNPKTIATMAISAPVGWAVPLPNWSAIAAHATMTTMTPTMPNVLERRKPPLTRPQRAGGVEGLSTSILRRRYADTE